MIHDTDFITDFIFVKSNIQPCDVILVPGGSRPKLAQKAAELYHAGMAKYIIFSGHANFRIPNFPSEAEYLKTIAIENDVPSAHIFCDHAAQHTFQNAEFSLDILVKNNFALDKFMLVCKGFHSRRALLTYQHVFPNDTQFFVVTADDDDSCPSRNNWTTKPEYIDRVMSEVKKIGSYFSDKICV